MLAELLSPTAPNVVMQAEFLSMYSKYMSPEELMGIVLKKFEEANGSLANLTRLRYARYQWE